MDTKTVAEAIDNNLHKPYTEITIKYYHTGEF
jgi:hypothetical protein